MYRTTSCNLWGDPWFADLPAHAKYCYLYLQTNERTTAAGLCSITVRKIAFDMSLTPAEIEAALAALQEAGAAGWWAEYQLVFLTRFYADQRANSNKDNFRKSAQATLSQCPAAVQAWVIAVYPDLAPPDVSHPYPIPIPSPSHRDKETVTETVTETERDAPARVDASADVAGDVAGDAAWGAVGHAVRRSHLSVVDDPAVATGERDYRTPRGAPLSPDWTLTPERGAWVATQCPHVLAPAVATAKFVAHHKARGERRNAAEWQAEWEKWMLGDEARALQDAAGRGKTAPLAGGPFENPATRDYLNMVEARNARRDAKIAANRAAQGVH